jgi:predicted nucleotidyltransferase
MFRNIKVTLRVQVIKMTPSEELNLSEIKLDLRRALEPHKEVIVAYLYGSSVKGYAQEDSDIDVGLLLDECYQQEVLYPEALARKIEKETRLNRAIDIRILNKRNPRFQYRVISEGELIISRDEGKRAQFEAKVASMYLDMKPFHETYDMYRSMRLRNEG